MATDIKRITRQKNVDNTTGGGVYYLRKVSIPKIMTLRISSIEWTTLQKVVFLLAIEGR